MTAVTAIKANYDRQISTESGWDNPFRPGGDLSREADEIVNMIKGGKCITPSSDVNHSITNGTAQNIEQDIVERDISIVDGAKKLEVSPIQTTPAIKNGTKSPQSKIITENKAAANGDTKPITATAQAQVSKDVMPGPTVANHVVIEDKKKKKCTCCVIQ